jgi:hypothetical protein
MKSSRGDHCDDLTAVRSWNTAASCATHTDYYRPVSAITCAIVTRYITQRGCPISSIHYRLNVRYVHVLLTVRDLL